jgi:hypothetical protein
MFWSTAPFGNVVTVEPIEEDRSSVWPTVEIIINAPLGSHFR